MKTTEYPWGMDEGLDKVDGNGAPINTYGGQKASWCGCRFYVVMHVDARVGINCVVPNFFEF